MQKVSLRIEDNMLKEIDHLVDFITVKNRSQAIKHLIKKSLDKERVAVIISKGSDKKNQDLENELLINKNEYNMTARIGDSTLIEEQIKKLKKYGFNIIYILTIEKIITNLRTILKKEGNFIHFIPIEKDMQTAAALKLLKTKLTSPFLVVFGDIFFEVNLNEIYNDHIKNNSVCTGIIASSHHPQLKGNLKVEGNKIISFEEKPSEVKDSIVSEPIYVADPQLLDIKGNSLVYDIFPKLAKEGLFVGHLTSGYVLHLHRNHDKKKIGLFLKKEL